MCLLVTKFMRQGDGCVLIYIYDISTSETKPPYKELRDTRTMSWEHIARGKEHPEPYSAPLRTREIRAKWLEPPGVWRTKPIHMYEPLKDPAAQNP